MSSYSDQSSDEEIQAMDIYNRYVTEKEFRIEYAKHVVLLYDFCEKFQMIKVKNDFIDFFRNALWVRNIIEIYEVLEPKHSELIKICKKFIRENASEILKIHDVLPASFETVFDIISSDILALNSELEVYNAIVEWGKSYFEETNPQILRELIFPLLKEVRFVSMTNFEFSGSPCTDGLLTKDEQLEIYKIKANPAIEKRGKLSPIESNWIKERQFEFLSSCYLSSECKNNLYRDESSKSILNIKGDFVSKIDDLKVLGVSIQVNVKLCKKSVKTNVDISLELIIKNLTNSDIKSGYDKFSLRENKNFSETEKIIIYLNEPVMVNKDDLFRIHVCSLHTDTDIDEFIYCYNYFVTYKEFETLGYLGDDYDCKNKPHFVSIIATY